LGGLEVDDKLELRGLLDGQVGGLRALEDLAHEGGAAPPEISQARPVRDEAPGLCILPSAVCCWQTTPRCQFCEPRSVELKHGVWHNDECPYALFGHRRECAVELGGTAGLQELQLQSQRPGGALHVSYRERVERIGRIRQDRHPADLGGDL